MFDRRQVLLLGAASLGAGLIARPAFADAENMTMDGLYNDTGADYSEEARTFNGRDVTLKGFMAPPLKPNAKFFVLGTQPMAVCPFCDSSATWPTNIVLIYTRDPLKLVNWDEPITVTGKLDLGVQTDQDTGFVSKVRMLDATYRMLPSVSIGF
ncbi:MAG TPA: hypothetical protein VHB74_01635 [Devosia sp.]|jgi:hypothetical protein|nr:hypothetical protein [Devosia sp.]